MTVVYIRVGNPVPGKQVEALKHVKERTAALNSSYNAEAEVFTRLDGPVGQIGVVSRFKNLAELETQRNKLTADVAAGKISPTPPGVFEEMRDFIYVSAA